MKKLIIFCAVILGFTAMTAMQVESTAEFKFEKETHDFGKIPQNKPVTVDFKFTNIGDEPLIISAVEPQCGCTVAKFTSTPIKKGGEGVITLTYNAATVSTFTKLATVKSNARTPVKYLYIKGEVVAAATSSSSK
ncbi:DUF1573 domain-containing protein [Hufsiella ginkgonis]|uniref:DUF1573 domain-containing protein n=1 Tax=Hufsiella ginkgonis TaxID=2695274 RepID=A0A7K1XVJ8_9SPHI|nr:DUF1573 domain-containing protein [Hufsiella ginkgonis]MXV15002.1 DUF1573 domain-containing protein [Hufsiella ginkgonis]